VALTPESDPQERAEELLADGLTTPLAEDANFQADLEWLADDQLAIMWINFNEIGVVADGFMAMSQVPDGFNFEELYDAYGMESAVVGVQATDAGIDVRFRTDGEPGEMADQSDWLERMGELRFSEVAAIMSLPGDLTELTQPVIDAVEGTFDAPLPGLDDYVRNQWDYELALTDDEFAEHAGLVSQWEAGLLAEDDPEFDRLLELDDQLWAFGVRSEYDAWIDSGNSDEQWRLANALTDEEYYEFLELEPLFDGDELEGAELDRFYDLDYRLYSFGVARDHSPDEPDRRGQHRRRGIRADLGSHVHHDAQRLVHRARVRRVRHPRRRAGRPDSRSVHPRPRPLGRGAGR